jgi:16S rRNA (adenine1518-N6/adenine1519-N6)-dimethyltransferase
MAHKHIAKKRFGQNFLSDQYIIDEIVRIINPNEKDNMVEIGPGLGALTFPLLENLGQLQVIELDRDIIAYLNTQKLVNLTINSCDALQFDFSTLGNELRVVGNLPYNISTPLLFHLANFSNIKDMYFMLQKEVVERICAKPNTRDYGRLSIMLQYKFQCSMMLEVGKECFKPQPQVESAIIRLKPRPLNEWQDIDEKKLNHVVTHAFNQRRKTISNSLKNVVDSTTLAKLGISINLRAENLTVTDYLKLSQQI